MSHISAYCGAIVSKQLYDTGTSMPPKSMESNATKMKSYFELELANNLNDASLTRAMIHIVSSEWVYEAPGALLLLSAAVATPATAQYRVDATSSWTLKQSSSSSLNQAMQGGSSDGKNKTISGNPLIRMSKERGASDCSAMLICLFKNAFSMVSSNSRNVKLLACTCVFTLALLNASTFRNAVLKQMRDKKTNCLGKLRSLLTMLQKAQAKNAKFPDWLSPSQISVLVEELEHMVKVVEGNAKCVIA